MGKFSHTQALLAVRIALLTTGITVGAGARETRTDLPVSATVRAVARLSTAAAPAQLKISAQDVRRGFVDVAQATEVSIVSNSARGYALEFQRLAPLFSAMQVHGLDGAVSIEGEAGTVVQRWQHPQAVSLSLTYRFLLMAGMSPGIYPWPVHLGVQPLDAL